MVSVKAQECDDSITYESIMEKTDLLYQYWGDGNKDKATEIALDLEKDLKNMPATVEKRLLEDVESQPHTRKKRDIASAIAGTFATAGAGYGGAYAVGQWCRNHNVDYWTGQAALLVAAGPFVLPMKALLALGFDNGWNSVK